MRSISVQLTQQQCDVLRILGRRLNTGDDLAATAKAAFLEYGSKLVKIGEDGIVAELDARREAAKPPLGIEYGELREDFILEPVTGKALPVRKGEILRFIQEDPGGQCVDFNAFNENDYKERMDVGRTRGYNGIFPKRGSFIYSNSPRDRVMFEIVEMPETCKAETIGARCNAAMFERGLGIDLHTNCQDTFTEAIGEYGLTPDDVHDSFNMWMNTTVDTDGRIGGSKNTAKQGDYVDLLAMFDTISVPIVCGSGDIMWTSNFWLKKIRIQIFAPSQQSLQRVEEIASRDAKLKNAREPSQFRVSEIHRERALQRDEAYRPEFVHFPLQYTSIEVELDESGERVLEGARQEGSLPGSTDEEIFRTCAMLAHLRGPDTGIRR